MTDNRQQLYTSALNVVGQESGEHLGKIQPLINGFHDRPARERERERERERKKKKGRTETEHEKGK